VISTNHGEVFSMKKWVAALFSILVLGFAFTFTFNQSDFDLVSWTHFSKGNMIEKENYYLGYGLHWGGLLKPRIVEVQLVGMDGTVVTPENPEVEITPFFDQLQHTGSLREADYLDYRERGLIDYVPVEDADISKYNTLVLKVKLKDGSYSNSVRFITLRYRVFGILKTQTLYFGGFLQ
jgi:hypothetical protein